MGWKRWFRWQRLATEHPELLHKDIQQDTIIQPTIYWKDPALDHEDYQRRNLAIVRGDRHVEDRHQAALDRHAIEHQELIARGKKHDKNKR